MLDHFLLLKLICFEQLVSYKSARFFWEFKFIFSCVRTDVKIWLQNLWQRYRKIPVKLEISVKFLVQFWYTVHVVLLTCSYHGLYSTFVLYIWSPVNTSIGLNWYELITCLSKRQQQLEVYRVKGKFSDNPDHNILALFNNLVQVRIAISKTILDI